MGKEIQNIGIGAATDILSAVDFGAAGFLAAIGNGVLSKLFVDRAENARKIALSEMALCKRSKFDMPDADQFVAIVYRYGRAALEGAATLNLQILAKIMRGQTVEGAIYASEFNEFAEVVSSLKTKEIVYLGTMIKLYKEGVLVQKGKDNEFYELDQSVTIQMYKSLVGTEHFPEARDFTACEYGLQRTSLIYPANQTTGGSIFAPTADLERLATLIEFDELLGDINA